MSPLTDTQEQVLAYMREFYELEDRLPSTRELQLAFGWKSQTSAVLHMKALERKGHIEKRERYYRFSRDM